MFHTKQLAIFEELNMSISHALGIIIFIYNNIPY